MRTPIDLGVYVKVIPCWEKKKSPGNRNILAAETFVTVRGNWLVGWRWRRGQGRRR